MKGGTLTKREAELLHRLLQERGITLYEIVEPIGEGTPLPSSHSDWGIERLSGTLVTPRAVYGFWLDWVDNDYTLRNWLEVPINEMVGADELVAIQQRLRQQGSCRSESHCENI